MHFIREKTFVQYTRRKSTRTKSKRFSLYEPHDGALNYKFLMVIAVSASPSSYTTVFSPLQHANKKRD